MEVSSKEKIRVASWTMQKHYYCKVYFHTIFVRHIHISARVWSLRREGEDIFIPFQSCLVEHLWWLRQFLKLSMQSIHIYTLQIQEYLCTLQWRLTRYLFFTLKKMIVLHWSSTNFLCRRQWKVLVKCITLTLWYQRISVQKGGKNVNTVYLQLQNQVHLYLSRMIDAWPYMKCLALC